MKQIITPKQIKANNRQLIYSFIYKEKKVTQLDISYALHLSRPTVTSNLVELEDAGMIAKNGQIDSESIGRKPVAYSVVPTYRVSIGVEITQSVVKVMALDLYARKIKREVLNLEYQLHNTYFLAVCEFITQFIDSLGLAHEQILGIGIAVQGLVSEDGTSIVFGKIMNNSGLSINVFSRHLDYPCCFIHDAESAAISEMWGSPEMNDAMFLLLSYHVGAALISNREVNIGKHGHSATIEHIPLFPNGKRCYCGKRGCIDTVLSMKSLCEDRDTSEFFEAVRRGEPEESAKWTEYLKNLARTIHISHLVYDTDFVLSGYLATYINERDLEYVYSEIMKMTPFEELSDFITVSTMPKHSITLGAALPYIRKFLNDIESA